MTESDPRQDGHHDQAPAGWRYVMVGEHKVLTLTEQHPDYPPELRERAIARDDVAFAQDPAIRAALARIVKRITDEQLILDQRWVLAAVHGVDIPAATAAVNDFIDTIARVVAAEEGALPPTKLARRRLTYLWRHVHDLLPPSIRAALDSNSAPFSAPFLVLVNTANTDIKPVLRPAETAIRLDRFKTGDLPKLGRIITEAQVIAGQVERVGKGGRPKLPDMSYEAATPELVAKLRHWEHWSYRRIAAFLGWLRPDEDWRDEKVRRRVEQHVRRWVRAGEGDLQRLMPANQDWRTRPDHVERAVEEERPRV